MIGGNPENELREIAAGLSGLAERIRSLSQRVAKPKVMSHSLESIFARADELSAVAEREYKLRRVREAYIACDHFGEPVWDMLLDLFDHTVRAKPISITSACMAAHCPPTTALRHIESLVKDGMLSRTPDPEDGRRSLLKLSDETLVSVGSFLMSMISNGAEPEHAR